MKTRWPALFVVTLAASAFGCGGSSTTGSGQNASASSGGVGGTPIDGGGGSPPLNGGGTGGGGIGGNDDCEWEQHYNDPMPVPLSCAYPAAQIFPPSVLQEGAELHFSVTWCGICTNYLCNRHGDIQGLSFQTAAPWTLVSVTQGCPHEVVLLPDEGSTQGALTMKASISGLDECSEPLTCPIEVIFQLVQTDAGEWIAQGSM